MGKDNKLLWIIAAVGAGWFLAPKDLKEQITGGMPSLGIDLSGLLGGGISQAPLGEGGLLPEFAWPAFEFPAFPEVPLLDYTGIIQDILDAGNTAAGVIGKAASDAANDERGGDERGGDVAPTPPSAPKGTWEWMMDEFTGLHPVVKNVVAGAVGLGGVYGAVKGVQAVTPAARITTDAMARTFAAVLRGKKPPVGGVTTVKPPPIPKWAKTPLGRQWIKFTSLGKVFRGGTPMFAIGGIAAWFQETLFGREGAVTTEEMMAPGMLWTGSGRYEPPDITLPTSLVTRPERTYITQSVPMRAERAAPRPLTLTEKYGTPEVKKPLYKPGLEGVQW